MTNAPSRRGTIILMGIVSLTFIAITTLLLISRYQLKTNLDDNDFRNTVEIYDASVQILFSNIESIMRSIASEVRVGVSPEELNSFTELTVAQLPALRNLLVVNVEGIVISDSRPDRAATGLDVSDREYFTSHFERRYDGILISDPVKSRIDDTWAIPISLAVRDDNNEIIGMVVTALEPQYFADIFGQLSDISGFIVNAEGIILATIPFDESRISTPLMEYSHNHPARSSDIDEDPFYHVEILNEGNQTVAHHHYAPYSLEIFFTRDKSSALVDFYGELLLIILGALMLLAATLLTLRYQYIYTHQSYYQSLKIQEETQQRLDAESAMFKERNLLRTLIDNIPDYIFIKDLDGRFIESNDAHTRATGLNREEILNRTSADLFEDLLAIQFEDDDNQILQDGMVLVNEERVTTSSDNPETYRWVLTTKLPLYEDKKIIGLVGISRDITHRRDAESELRENEERLRMIIANMSAIIFEVDHAGIIQMIEGKALSHIGVDVQNLHMTSIFDLFGKYVENLEQIFESVIKGQEQNHLLPINDLIFDAYYLPRYNDDGEIISVIGIANDITGRLEAERIRLEIEKERQLLELKERFIATASHDFRTPLSVIQTSADMLIRYDDKLDAKGRLQRLNRIQWQVSHMVSLLDNILKLSEINEGRIEPDMQPIELRLFCERVWSDVSDGDAVHSNSHFEYHATVDVIHIDEHLMQYALMNVLSNAFKYTLDEDEVHFIVRDSDGGLAFCVIDQGIGVPAKDVDSLFEPFFRASNSPAGKGKGLGLSIVKHYVELHNGTITVNSEEGQGTSLIITLPHVR